MLSFISLLASDESKAPTMTGKCYLLSNLGLNEYSQKRVLTVFLSIPLLNYHKRKDKSKKRRKKLHCFFFSFFNTRWIICYIHTFGCFRLRGLPPLPLSISTPFSHIFFFVCLLFPAGSIPLFPYFVFTFPLTEMGKGGYYWFSCHLQSTSLSKSVTQVLAILLWGRKILVPEMASPTQVLHQLQTGAVWIQIVWNPL